MKDTGNNIKLDISYLFSKPSKITSNPSMNYQKATKIAFK